MAPNPLYVIQATWAITQGSFQGYLKTQPSYSFVSSKSQATQYSSKVAANGWLLQAQMFYPTYRFTVVLV